MDIFWFSQFTLLLINLTFFLYSKIYWKLINPNKHFFLTGFWYSGRKYVGGWENDLQVFELLDQACQTQTHVRATLSYSKTNKKLSVCPTFEKFSKFYCLEALLYDNLVKN
jgi:hypothetical protein